METAPHLLQQIESWAGLSGRDPATQDAYARLLFPYDTPRVARALAHDLSSCALTGLAVYRLYGIDDPALRRPYAGHTDAVTQVVQVARRRGAWRIPGPTIEPPGTGDVVLLCCPEHVYCITEYDSAGGLYTSVEGGQGPSGTEIGKGLRQLVWYQNELWGVRPEAAYLASGRPNGRKVQGYASYTALVSG